ncbi:MAG: hypothetical protein CFE40_02380 [Burkholderiales bacterium PBB1]|nr:MAG: hypothetical protein CFE40_02380 [Burkholderiales bacterium PBB1]
MDMPPARKRMALLIVVVGSALIGERVVALMGDDTSVVEPAQRASTRARTVLKSSPSSATEPSTTRVQLDRLDRNRQASSDEPDARDESLAAVFDAVSWRPPAPQAEAAAPPPAPVAPPFPYTYLGGLSEDGVRTTFFNQGDRVLPVKAGDTIDAVYRVEQMNEKNMTLTYLPLNQSLTVNFRSGG